MIQYTILRVTKCFARKTSLYHITRKAVDPQLYTQSHLFTRKAIHLRVMLRIYTITLQPH